MTEKRFQYVLPRRMKGAMERQGLSVPKLARMTAISSKTLYGWLSGYAPRSLEDVFSVSRALGMTMEELAFAQHNDLALSNPSIAFGQWLKACRDRVRMSPIEAAKSLEIEVSQLDDYEAGEDIPVSVLMKLAALYQIDNAVLAAKLSMCFVRL